MNRKRFGRRNILAAALAAILILAGAGAVFASEAGGLLEAAGEKISELLTGEAPETEIDRETLKVSAPAMPEPADAAEAARREEEERARREAAVVLVSAADSLTEDAQAAMKRFMAERPLDGAQQQRVVEYLSGGRDTDAFFTIFASLYDCFFTLDELDAALARIDGGEQPAAVAEGYYAIDRAFSAPFYPRGTLPHYLDDLRLTAEQIRAMELMAARGAMDFGAVIGRIEAGERCEAIFAEAGVINTGFVMLPRPDAAEATAVEAATEPRAGEEQLEDSINNLVAMRQRYQIDLNKRNDLNSQSDIAVSPQSGTVTMRQTDYHLPGVNGMDLDITRIYRDDQAMLWEPRYNRLAGNYGDSIVSQWDNQYFMSFYEKHYNLGSGTRFSFPAVEKKGLYRYLHMEDGSVYRLVDPAEGADQWRLEGYPFDDLKITNEDAANPFYNEPAPTGKSALVMTDRNGKKTYFSDDGRVLGMVDRYGNEIKFAYRAVSYRPGGGAPFNSYDTRVLISTITDTAGRVVTFEYGQDAAYQVPEGGDLAHRFDVKITLPDGKMLIYEKQGLLYDSMHKSSTRERICAVRLLEDAAQYGVDGNYGTIRYAYQYEKADCKFTYSQRTNYPMFEVIGLPERVYNQWGSLSVITYDSNRQKTFVRSEQVKRFGSSGSMTCRRVSQETDGLAGEKEPVQKLEYTYSSGPDDYTNTDSIFPLIDFESEGDANLFIHDQYYHYSRKKGVGKDGTYGFASSVGAVDSKAILPVMLDRPGELMFDMFMDVGSWKSARLNLMIGDQKLAVFETTNGIWETKKVALPKGRLELYFYFEYDINESPAALAEPRALSSPLYLDNISVGYPYSTQIRDLCDPHGTSTRLHYNAKNQQERMETLGPDQYAVQETEYDNYNQPREIVTAAYDLTEGGQPDAPVIRRERLFYDGHGNLLTHYDPDTPELFTKFTYAGAEQFYKPLTRTVALAETGAVQETTRYTLDAAGNTTKEVRQEGAVTELSYDEKGNILQKQSRRHEGGPVEAVTRYEYGPVGSCPGGLYLTRESKGEQAAPLEEKEYGYDFASGLMTSETTRCNAEDTAVTAYTYDANYRVTDITYPDGTHQQYEYHDYGFGGDKNRAVRVSGQNEDVLSFYDIFGNLTASKEYGAQDLLTRCEYDSGQNLTKQTDANGTAVRYEYDSAGRITEKSVWEQDDAKKSAVTVSYRDERDKLGYRELTGVKKAVSGLNHEYLLKEDGTVWEVGLRVTEPWLIQIPELSGVTDIAAGYSHFLALDSAGEIWSWGSDTYGERGDGDAVISWTTPGKVMAGSTKFKQIAAGSNTSFAIDTEGGTWAWGWNTSGQLGLSYNGNQNRPAFVTYPRNHSRVSPAESIFTAGEGVFVINSKGYLWYWGLNFDEEYVTYYKEPQDSASKEQGAQYTGTRRNILRRNPNGALYGRGDNRYGQLGRDTGEPWFDNYGKILENVREASMGETHALAVKDDGTVWSWGTGVHAELGTGKTVSYVPEQVAGLSNISHVTAGNQCSIAISGDGRAWVWGYTGEITGMTHPVPLMDGAPEGTSRSSAQVTNENGGVTTQFYDGAGRLVAKETSPDGVQVYRAEQEFDERGYLYKLTDARGNATRFYYDHEGRRYMQIDALEQVTSCSYDSCGRIYGVTEPGGVRTETAYDLAGRPALVKKWKGLGQEYDFTEYEGYDLSGNALAIRQGHTASGDGGRVTDARSVLRYDGRRRVIEKKDWIEGERYSVTAYEYNAAGDKTKETALDANGAIETTWSYDSRRRVVMNETRARYNGSDVGVSKTGYGYDAAGNVTRKMEYTSETDYLSTDYMYDYASRLTDVFEPVGTGDAVRAGRSEYDARGNLLSSTLVSNGIKLTTAYTYDGLDRVTSKTDALGNTARYSYDAAGNKTAETDGRFPGGAVEDQPGMRYSYDALNRLVKTAYDSGAGTVETLEEREYDEAGNVAGIKTDGASQASRMRYDAQGRMTEYASAAVAAMGDTAVGQRITYDALGNKLSITQYTSAGDSGTVRYEYYGTGQLKAVRDPEGGAQLHRYDDTGRLYEETTAPNGGVTKISRTLFGDPYRTEYPDGTQESADFQWFLGLAVAVVDRKGRKKQYKYDKQKNPILELFTYKTDGHLTYTQETELAYDEWDNLLARESFYHWHDFSGGADVRDSLRKESYEYDAAFRLARAYDDTGRETRFEYDAAGNEITRKVKTDDNAYDVTRAEYDGMNRKTKEITLLPFEQLHSIRSYPADAEYPHLSAVPTASCQYRGTKVTKMTTAEGKGTLYTYDDAGQATSVTTEEGEEQRYHYDYAGQVTQETAPNGKTTRYGYDKLGRVTSKTELSANGEPMVWKTGYDAMGNVISESTPALSALGEAFTYTYDVMNRKTSMTDADGNVLAVYGYDNADNLIKTVDARNGAGTADIAVLAGDEIEYDAFDRPVEKTDCLGNSTGYWYNRSGNMTASIDAKGQRTEYEYNKDDTLARVRYPDGGETSYTYDKKGRALTESVRQSDSVTLTTSYRYTPFDAVAATTDAAGNTQANKYDGEGNLRVAADWRGNLTTYSYWSGGRVRSINTQLDDDTERIETRSYSGADVKMLSVSGGGARRRTDYTYVNGFQTAAETNAGQRTEYLYDDFGNMTAMKKLRGGTDYDVTETAYDKYGRTIATAALMDAASVKDAPAGLIGADGFVRSKTEYTYDVMGSRTSVKGPKAFAEPENGALYTVNYSYDNAGRLIAEQTMYDDGAGPAPSVTSYSYDELGNRTAVTDAKGGMTTYSYDALSRVSSVTDAVGTAISYGYDLAGNKVSEARPSGTWTYEYDALNRLSATKRPDGTVSGRLTYDANGNVTKKTDGNGNGVEYAYDAANRPVSMTMPEGGATVTAYDAFDQKTSVTDPLGSRTAYAYDGAGNLTAVTDAAGAVTTFTYDLAGNRLSMTDALGNETAYEYTMGGLLSGETDPLSRTRTYRYTLTGKAAEQTDPKGNVTSYRYNPMDSLTETAVVLQGETEAREENRIRFSFDKLGNRTSMEDATGTTSYTYDAMNRLTAVTKDGAEQISYTYTLEGQTASASYNGTTTGYTYDSAGRMTKAENGGVSAQYAYDAAGNVKSVTYPAGGETFTYDRNNNVKAVENTAGGQRLSRYEYTYDAAGRQTKKTAGSDEYRYSYDAVGRVTEVQEPEATKRYSYDAAGNRVAAREEYAGGKALENLDNAGENGVEYWSKEITYSYDAAGELTRTDEDFFEADGKPAARKETQLSYDANGNQLLTTSGMYLPDNGEADSVSLSVTEEGGAGSGGGMLMSRSRYDGFNRLVELTNTKEASQVTIQYRYNGDGLRTEKTETDSGGSRTVGYVYDGQHVAYETGTAAAAYVRGLDYIARNAAGGGASYYYYNAHGDVVQTADEGGTVENRYEYDVFGEAQLSEQTRTNPIRYSGEFYDESAGLYYLRSRYYNPSAARFTTRDTYAGDASDPRTLNRYAYCNNDPINYVDPSGHKPQSAINIAAVEHAYKVGVVGYDEYAANVRLNGGAPRLRPGTKKIELKLFHGKSPSPEALITNYAYLSDGTKSKLQNIHEAKRVGAISDQEYVEGVIKIGDYINSGEQFEYDYSKLIVGEYNEGSIYQIIESAPKGVVVKKDEDGNAMYQDLTLDELRALFPNEENRYSNHEFTVNDAIYWLLQTGGNINIILNVRDLSFYASNDSLNTNRWRVKWNDTVSANVEEQFDIISKFIDAAAFINGNTNIKVQLPRFFVGTPHFEWKDDQLYQGYHDAYKKIYVDMVSSIYNQITEKINSKVKDGYRGDLDIIPGFYYGREDPPPKYNNGMLYLGYEVAAATADRVHDMGKQLLWIPYTGNRYVMENIGRITNRKYTSANGELKDMFDIVILQPGLFFQETGPMTDEQMWERVTNVRASVANQAIQWNGEVFGGWKETKTKIGFELEYDMSLITGRRQRNYNPATPYNKINRLKTYFDLFGGFIPNKYIPVGIYSGGPNEQDYAHPFSKNGNMHNSQNHVQFKSYYWEEDHGSGKRAGDMVRMHYSDIAQWYAEDQNLYWTNIGYNSNLIYDITEGVINYRENGNPNWKEELEAWAYSNGGVWW